MFQKSDAKIQITKTMARLIRINYPLIASIVAFLTQTLQISTKSAPQFLSNSFLKNGTQKQNFPIWKIPIKILTAKSVTNDIIWLHFCDAFVWRKKQWFLANVNSSSCSLYVVVRPSVVCLPSVCL